MITADNNINTFGRMRWSTDIKRGSVVSGSISWPLSSLKLLLLYPVVMDFSENFDVVGISGVNVGPVFRFGFPVPQIVLKMKSIVKVDAKILTPMCKVNRCVLHCKFTSEYVALFVPLAAMTSPGERIAPHSPNDP